MQIVRFDVAAALAIGHYGSHKASSIVIADGEGEAHVHFVVFEPGGLIGSHEAGFGQLFMPVAGAGWAAGADGTRVTISPGEAAVIGRGETHSKGSDTGMTALIIQIHDLNPRPAVVVLGP